MLINKIKQQKKLFLSLVIGMTVLAISTAFVLPEKFEAKVTVRSATVGFVGQQGQQGQSTAVESNTQTLSRLGSPRFYTEALTQTCGVIGNNANEVLSKLMKATAVKTTTDLTSITYTAKGQAQTSTCLQAVIDHLAAAQEELSSSRKRQLQTQLAAQKTAVGEIEKSEIDLKAALAKNGLSNRSPAESALMLYGLQSKQNLLQEAKRSVIELSAALEPPMTQKLIPLEPIYVSANAVSPNPFLFGFGGLFFGLLICTIICWREVLALLNSDNDPAPV